MASIILETFGDGDDKALQLPNQEWGRLLSIGSAWTRLRIGVMANLIPAGTSNIGNASLRLGFSNAADKHVGSGSGKLWYGGVYNNTANIIGGTFTYQAGSGNPYFRSGGGARIRQLDTTFSGATGSGSPVIFTNDGSTKRRTCIFVELKKSGTSMIVGLCYLNDGTAGLNRDYTLDEFRTAMTNPADIAAGSGISVGGINHTPFGITTFTNHDTNAATHGETVAAHVGWNKELTNIIQIFAIEVYRHAA